MFKKSKKELVQIIEELRSENEELRGLLQKDDSKNKLTTESFIKQNKILAQLNKFSIELAFLDYKEVFPYIVSTFQNLFQIKYIFINIYEEETKDLIVKYASLTDEENSRIIKYLGSKAVNRRTHLSDEHYSRIVAETYSRMDSINELTFGSIPDSIGKTIERLFGIDWFVGVALINREKLIGTLIISGDKEQNPPAKDEIISFVGIIANALERKKAEEALVESEEKYRTLFQNSAMAVGIRSLDRSYKEFNNSYAKMLGYSQEELKTLKQEQLTHPDDIKLTLEKMQLIAEGKSEVEFYQKRYIHKDGSVVWGEVCVQPLKEEDGTITGIIGTIGNITGRKKAEESLLLFKQSLENASVAIGMATPQGKHFYQNSAFTKIFGEIGDYPPDSVFVDKEEGEKLFKTVMSGELWSGEIKMYSKDRKILDILLRAYASKDSSGNITALVGFHTDITASKKEKESLLRTQFAMDNAKDSILWVNDEATIVYANHAACSNMGYSREELCKMKVFEIDPDFPVDGWEKHKIDLKQKGSMIFEGRHKCKDGRIFPVEVSTFYFNDKGNFLACAFDRDISERKKAEKILKESEENLAITLNSIGDGVISTDRNGVITRMNPAAEILCGWNMNDAVNKNLNEVFVIVDAITREPIENPVQKVIDSGEIVELSNHTILIGKDGTERNISDSAAPIKDNEGNIRGVVLVFSDVTETYKARELLRKSEERFSLVVDASEQGIWDWDIENDKVYYSPQWKNQVGYNDSELKNVFETWAERLHPEDKDTSLTIIKNYLENPIKNLELEFRLHHKDGSYRWIHNKASSILNKSGKVIRMFGAHTDITERKRAEAELQQSNERLRTILDSIEAFIYIADIETYELLFVNEYGKQTWGDIKIGEKCFNVLQKEMGGPCPFCTNNKLLTRDGNPADVITWEFQNTNNGRWYECNDRAIQWIDGRLVRIEIAFDITDRKNAEKEIAYFNELMRYLIEHTSSSVAVHDKDMNYIYVSNRYYDDLRITDRNIIGRNHYDIFPYLPQSIRDSHQRALKGEVVSAENDQLIHSDGSMDWANWQCRPWYNADGEIGGIIIYIEIITERRKAEIELRASEENLRLLIELAPDAFLHGDKNGDLIGANNKAIEMFGYSKDELLLLNIKDLFPPEELKNSPLQYDLLKSGKTLRIERQIKKKNGELIFAEMNSRSMPNGTYQSFIRDITERKRAEEALKQAQNNLAEKEAQYRLIAENSKDLIYVYSLIPEPRYEYISPSCFQITGYTPEEGYADPFAYHKFLIEPSCLDRFTKFLMDPLHPTTIEEEWKKKDGTHIWVEQSISRNFDDNSNLVSFQSTVRDITERKQIEIALKESEELHRKLLMTVPDLIIRTDLHGNIIFVNESVFPTLNILPVEQLLGKNMLDFIAEEDRDRAIENTKMMFERPLGPKEYWIQIEDEYKILCEVNGDITLDADNNPNGMVYVVRDITERRKTEKALKESEEKFRSLVQNSVMGIYRTLLNGNIVMANPALVKMLGYDSFEELAARNLNKAGFSKDSPRYEFVAQFEKTDVVEGLEAVWVRKDGSEIFVRESSKVIRDSSNDPMYFEGTVEDITERKKAVEALKESEERFSKAFRSSPAPLVISEIATGKFIDVNEQWIRMLGHTREECLAKTSKELGIWSEPEDRDNAIELIKAKGYFKNVPIRFVTKNGEFRDTFWSAEKINLHGKEVMLSMIFDYTEQRMIEKALHKSEEKLKSIFRAAPIGIGLVSDRVFVEVNDEVCSLTGYSREELIGNNARFLYPSEEEYNFVGQQRPRHLTDKGIINVETKWLRKDGSIIDILLSSTPIDVAGIVFGITFTAVDITERKKTEEQIKKNLAEKEILLKEIHHRVKNNLQIISSLLFLQSQTIKEKEYEAVFRDSQSRVRSIALVHEKLYQTDDLANIDFAEYVKNLTEFIRKSYRLYKGEIEIRFELESIFVPINMAVPLGLIMNELLTNSFKYAFPDGGGSDTKNKYIMIKFSSIGNEKLTLSVSDNGVGLPDDFNPEESKSLGLKLVNTLVRQINGSLSINKKDDTTFTIGFSK